MPFIIDARNMGGGSIGSAAGGDTSTGTRNNVTLAAPWDESKEYLKGDLATNNGDLYQAQKSVPAGVQISDEDYWALVVAGDKSADKMDKTNPTGTGSFSMNRREDTVVGYCSHAEGMDTAASGYSSHAEGLRTTASEYSSHAEGAGTTASGNNSHAEGVDTTASGYCSHAEGYETTASGSYSHAEGYRTTASGHYSHAEGADTTVSGERSHAEGDGTTASGDFSHVQGKYNIEDTSNKYADIIGNGTFGKRSNAATVDWNGNAWFAGDVYTGSTSGTNKDDGSKKLATEEYVDNSIAAGGTDISLGLTSAAVGQTIKVKAVDESGKPTAWEAAEMAGGAEHWEKIADIDLRSDTSKYVLADFGVWRKAKVIMTRPKFIGGLQKNVWAKVVKKGYTSGYNCGYLDLSYGYVYWEFAAEVDDLFISSTSFDNNNPNIAVAIKSPRTLTPLDGATSEYEFILLFTDTSVIQEGDRVTVIGVKR